MFVQWLTCKQSSSSKAPALLTISMMLMLALLAAIAALPLSLLQQLLSCLTPLSH